MASSSGSIPSVVKPDDPGSRKRDTMMVVQDLCDKWDATPSYSTTELKGQVFRSKLTVKSNVNNEATLTAEAVSSLSRKDAEQFAAWQILPDLMTIESPFNFPPAVETIPKIRNEPSQPKSTSAAQSKEGSDTAIEAISGWPIVELKNLCVKYGLPLPTYTLKEWNFPFSKTVYSIKCRINDQDGPLVREVGRYSLEDAKVDVAIHVLDSLKLKWAAANKKKAPKGKFNVVVKANEKFEASTRNEKATVASSCTSKKTAASASPKNESPKKSLAKHDVGGEKRRRLSSSSKQ